LHLPQPSFSDDLYEKAKVNPINVMHIFKPGSSGNMNIDEKLLHLLHETILSQPKKKHLFCF